MNFQAIVSSGVTFAIATCSALTAQDLNLLRDRHVRLDPEQSQTWIHHPSDGASDARFDVFLDGMPAPVDNFTLPLHRIGFVACYENGADKWRMLAGGTENIAGGTLPTVRGKLLILDIERVGNQWSASPLLAQAYTSIDPWLAAITDDGMLVLDYMTGNVLFTDQIQITGSTPDLPSEAEFSLVSSGSSGPAWRDDMSFVLVNETPGANGWFFESILEPRQVETIAKSGSTWISTVSTRPARLQGEILVRNEPSISQTSGMQVKINGGAGGTMTIKDPSGNVLHTANVPSNSWVTVPPIAAFAANPGLPHVVSCGGQSNEFHPNVRYGTPGSTKPGFALGSGIMNLPLAGHPFHHGVTARADAQLANQVGTLFVKIATRDPSGGDPVVQLPNGAHYLNTNLAEVHPNITVGKIHGTFGFALPTTSAHAGTVVLFQYIMLFHDGSFAWSDVFGSTVR